MYTFKDISSDATISFESVDELTIQTATDFVTGEVTAYIAELEGVPYEVSEEFYKKVKEEKGIA